jgi:hypothetical protein
VRWKTRINQNSVENVEHHLGFVFGVHGVVQRIPVIPVFAQTVEKDYQRLLNRRRELSENAEAVANLMNWTPSFASPAVRR